jgi:hypothetical protein
VAINYGQVTFNHDFNPGYHYAEAHDTSVTSLRLGFVPPGGPSGDDGTAVFLSIKSDKLNAHVASTRDISRLKGIQWAKTIRFDSKKDAALVRFDEDGKLELLVTRLREACSWRFPLPIEEG